MKRDFSAPPTIDRSNLVEIYQVKINQTSRLECPMDGKPKPHIMWLINGRDLNADNSKHSTKENETLFVLRNLSSDRYEFLDNNRIFLIHSVQLSDNARYTCIGTNIAGELSNHIELQIFSMSSSSCCCCFSF